MKHNLLVALAVALAASPVAAQSAPEQSEQVPAPDPVHLAAAERVALHIWPDGTWRRQMDGMMNGLFSTMMESLTDPESGMAESMFGKNSKEARQAANPRAASNNNPLAGPEGMDRFMAAFVNAIAPMMTEIEPEIRSGIAASAARRFSAEQLSELEGFFATPTGSAYAGQSMLMLTDPEVLQATMSMLPRMMESMPQIMEQVAAETGIPMPSPTERAAAQAAADAASYAGVKVE